ENADCGGGDVAEVIVVAPVALGAGALAGCAPLRTRGVVVVVFVVVVAVVFACVVVLAPRTPGAPPTASAIIVRSNDGRRGGGSLVLFRLVVVGHGLRLRLVGGSTKLDGLTGVVGVHAV